MLLVRVPSGLGTILGWLRSTVEVGFGTADIFLEVGGKGSTIPCTIKY